MGSLLPYAVIVEATSGDVVAIQTVLRHYCGYINFLATRNKDSDYNRCIDEEARCRLETKLIAALLKFKI